jgi:hypothetical protein
MGWKGRNIFKKLLDGKRKILPRRMEQKYPKMEVKGRTSIAFKTFSTGSLCHKQLQDLQPS